MDEPIESVGHIDAAVVWDPERTGAGSRVAEALRFESPPVPIIRFEGVYGLETQTRSTGYVPIS